ncbi:SDR family oxidoreductase [Parasalinivibrio latis]|uniref:SDR family NAD(P)-dependent oxidoreductase n=1 Tax=Parasalinivibrio latis TaxID=2952610 RepID=UPI0030E3A3CE
MKTALVTGGSKGIGLAVVKAFSEKGYRVITCSRNGELWERAKSENEVLAGVEYHSVDISNPQQVESMFSKLRARNESLDVLVNNASPHLASAGEFSTVDYDALKATIYDDFLGHAHCLKAGLALMERGGAVVNVSSVNGLRPTPNAAMYSAAKHAMEGLTRSVALEVIGKGIRVNAVAPGVTWTPRWEKKKEQNPNICEEVEKVVPAGRFADPREIAKAIMWLCSDEASYVVGHTLVIDGGLSLQ